MSKTIKLTDGIAVLSEIVTYGLKKRINAVLFRDRAFDVKQGIATIGYKDMEDARNIGILGLLEKLTVGIADLPLTQESLESLLAEDYESIAEAANSILNPPEEAKKKKK